MRFIFQSKDLIIITMKIFIVLLTIAIVLSTSDYKITNVNQTTSSISLFLEYTGNQTFFGKPTSPIIKSLVFTLYSHTLVDFSFKITDVNRTRWQVPQGGYFPTDPQGNFTFPLANSAISLSYNANPFDFKIVRKLDNATLFDTSKGKIIFSDVYLEISTSVPTQIAYGLSERFSNSFRLKEGTYTVFNRDRPCVIDYGNGGEQTYGYYPVHFVRERSGQFHLAYFRSSNAMDVIIKNDTTSSYVFTYKVIGGIFDFRFYLGELNPQLLLEKFQLYGGRSTIPPFWSFGFHQCRWGYQNVGQLEAVIQGYQSNDLPLDTIWTDIDYMKDYEDFTIDESRFPLDRMNKILQKYRYIPIIDAGVKRNDGQAYKEGQKRNVFLKDADGNQYKGKVWPGDTAFVDFFNPNATTYWDDMLNKLYAKIKFNGVWLDMNQIANFCAGPCEISNTTKKFDYTNDLPYTPGGGTIQGGTVSLNATHYGGRLQANVHIYFGYLQAYATNMFLTSKGLRPFIISRSSTLGFNQIGFHWTGDNVANFDFLKISIANNFMFQFWGINMVGADICGFAKDTNVELCARWMQLGSLYTFARNHNEIGAMSQQPYALGPEVLQASKTNLKLRYSILKFYYRHFINKRGLGTIFRPLFIDFPQDLNTYNDSIAETQFIIGNQIMAAPIVNQGTEFRSVYFPQVAWYEFNNGQKRYQANSTVAIQNKITDPVPLFLREGTAVLVQNTQNVTKTYQLNNVFTLKAALAFLPRNSTTDIRKYEAVAGTLSIIDYNDETKVSRCIREGCEYTFRLLFTLSVSSLSLEIDTLYTGGAGLNQLQIIDTLQMFYEDGTKFEELVNPVQIRGNGKIVVPIDWGMRRQKNLVQQ